MNVLVACEESQRVCIEFRKRGHNAFSCDLQECSGGHPEWHIQGDVLRYLNPFSFMPPDVFYFVYGIPFATQDGKYHEIIGKWDLIIAHPPCIRLCNSGQRWLYWGDKEYRSQKISEQQKSIVFFMLIATADCEKIVIENPQGIMSSAYRKPDCIYNPYEFEGETEAKTTCLWLKGVSPLVPTRKVPLDKSDITHGIYKSHFQGKTYAWGTQECSRLRSQTPIGVAKAMAEQWG